MNVYILVDPESATTLLLCSIGWRFGGLDRLRSSKTLFTDQSILQCMTCPISRSLFAQTIFGGLPMVYTYHYHYILHLYTSLRKVVASTHLFLDTAWCYILSMMKIAPVHQPPHPPTKSFLTDPCQAYQSAFPELLPKSVRNAGKSASSPGYHKPPSRDS